MWDRRVKSTSSTRVQYVYYHFNTFCATHLLPVCSSKYISWIASLFAYHFTKRWCCFHISLSATCNNKTLLSYCPLPSRNPQTSRSSYWWSACKYFSRWFTLFPQQCCDCFHFLDGKIKTEQVRLRGVRVFPEATEQGRSVHSWRWQVSLVLGEQWCVLIHCIPLHRSAEKEGHVQ